MTKLTGISVSAGIVIGKAFLYLGGELPDIPQYAIKKNQIKSEWSRFQNAVRDALGEVQALHDLAKAEMTENQADIFAAHRMMLEDSDFHDQIKSRLESRLENIEHVVREISHEMTEKLAALPDAYLRERAVDITDVSNRIINALLSTKQSLTVSIKEDVILVAHDLLPSELLALDRKHVKGIVMDMGSRTSHTAILAQAFNIPAVLGLSSATTKIAAGDTLVIDGPSGQVIINPSANDMAGYTKAAGRYRRTAAESLTMGELPAETRDGYRVRLKANIETPEDAERALRYGAEGVGLYRSEFFFLTGGQLAGGQSAEDRTADEERQYQAYSRVFSVMGEKPVTIRTLDAGGDKLLPGLQAGDEKNPLLGWRAIRFCLAMPELFKTQLRAILRAGVHGNGRIMFPLISGIEELEQALALLEEAKAECRSRGQPYADTIEAGIMIELPSAAMTADILARRAAFFSIGTNDLIQYSLAADRGNEKVNYLAQWSHPAVLRFLRGIIDAAHEAKLTAAMCGELAGVPQAAALLTGLGLDEFSMTASSIPLIKRVIRGTTLADCRELARQALDCVSYKDVTALLESWTAERFPGL
ncbi:MAG: phosphoenolpyruvate--protein phosphotransferase [Spirochaetaceae bacterium]|jgi:phosphotransferase system enzyme I (PtsI)|nr:phosphoenolpyruvate--protein phosphotransferase [Spirochaetaceae bacterium]